MFIVASDAWNVVTREITWQRWAVCASLLAVMAVIAYLARSTSQGPTYFRSLIVAVVLSDLVLASFAVYTERGMSSRGVALYCLAIVSSAALLNRSAVFGAAILSTATYILATTRYFFVNFNEGYKAELYTTLWLYSATFFMLAALLWLITGSYPTPPRRNKN